MRDGPPVRKAAPAPGTQYIPPAPGPDEVDDYEDLDELDTDEDDLPPPTQTPSKGGKGKGSTGAKKGILAGALNKPRHVSLNCKQLHRESRLERR